jgi:hypothetical protein
MGRLDDTSTPLPSGGVYIGGMLTRTFGLVGFTSMVSGSDHAGGAIAFAWGMGAQWWPTTRVSLRLGPALVLDWDPGFTNTTLDAGLNAAVSFAFIKIGRLALDLRFDVTASRSSTFGSLGVGVNLN